MLLPQHCLFKCFKTGTVLSLQKAQVKKTECSCVFALQMLSQRSCSVQTGRCCRLSFLITTVSSTSSASSRTARSERYLLKPSEISAAALHISSPEDWKMSLMADNGNVEVCWCTERELTYLNHRFARVQSRGCFKLKCFCHLSNLKVVIAILKLQLFFLRYLIYWFSLLGEHSYWRMSVRIWSISSKCISSAE